MRHKERNSLKDNKNSTSQELITTQITPVNLGVYKLVNLLNGVNTTSKEAKLNKTSISDNNGDRVLL